MDDAERHARVELTRLTAKDPRSCGHQSLVEDPACTHCAFELGRRTGHCEAGAYFTGDEVFGDLRKRYDEGAPKTSDYAQGFEAGRRFRDG